MISLFFIRRPVFACVISILLVLLGGVAYVTLPVEQYPELAPPIVRVEAQYPGANAQTIADTVASPLEQEINGVDRMIYMSSTSSDGRYQLDVSFEPGTDVDLASVLVQNRVNIAEPRLPEEARRLGVTTRKQSTAFVGVLSISSPDGRYDDLFLANYVYIRMRDEVLRVPGVGAVNINPAKDYGMRVWLDPQKLRARGLTVSDVNAAIRAQNVQVAAGVIGRQPVPEGQAFELVVTTRGRLSTPEEFGAIIVRSSDGGRLVRLRDVARVELGARDYTTLAGYNGSPGAIMAIYQLPGANLVNVAQQIEELRERFAEELPPGVELDFFYDASMFIEASIEEVQHTLIEAFLLVALVVLVFLQSLRSTLIPLIVIPVSLVGTFLFMALFGFSVNMLTMFALVLAIGIVVDDAIVVVENVERNLQQPGITAKEATGRAMGQITGAVVAITLVLMSVFIPTAALPGITGEMYRQFALTIAASTLLSAVCALTLTPALCGLLLRPHAAHGHGHPGGRGGLWWMIRRVLGWPARAFNAGFDALAGAYGGFTRFAIRLAPLSLAAFVAVLVASAVGYTRVPTGFVPNEDLGFVVVASQLPDGSSLERSQAVNERVVALAREVDGVQNVTSLSGFSVLDGQGVSYANAWIVLEPWAVRTPKGRGVEVVMQDLRAAVAGIQDAQFLVFSLPPINGLGNTSGFDLRLLDRTAVGRSAVQGAVDAVVTAANGQSDLAYAFSSFRSGVPQLYLDIDREKAMRLNVPLPAVFETLQTALGSTYVNDFNLFNRTYQVSTQAEAAFRIRPDQITRLETRNVAGQMVPLGSLLRVEESMGPDRVTRYNLYPSATVNGAPAAGVSSGQAMAIMEGLARDQLPEGMGYAWTGLSYQEKQAGSSGLLAFALGILVIYLILAAQYESWSAPLSVVLSVPLVVAGAVVALMATGLDNNIFTQIGLVLLVGLGAKNAILIVEFARQNRASGKAVIESAVEAARTRFRPILMTSFAFVLGVVPLVVAEGAGAASRRALGTAVFGGMIGVTVLGLVFTPVLFAVVTWTSEWLGRLGRRGGGSLSVGNGAVAGGTDA